MTIPSFHNLFKVNFELDKFDTKSTWSSTCQDQPMIWPEIFDRTKTTIAVIKMWLLLKFVDAVKEWLFTQKIGFGKDLKYSYAVAAGGGAMPP